MKVWTVSSDFYCEGCRLEVICTSEDAAERERDKLEKDPENNAYRILIEEFDVVE